MAGDRHRHVTRPDGPVSADGAPMSIAIIGMHRFENGQVAETWTSWDNMTAARQLGLLPAA